MQIVFLMMKLAFTMLKSLQTQIVLAIFLFWLYYCGEVSLEIIPS